MAFITILTVVIIGYVFLYIGMIVYDLFIKKSVEDLIPKQEDEDVDISDEARQFQPVIIEKESKPNEKKKENSPTKEQQEGVNQDNAPSNVVGFDESESTKRKSLNDIEKKLNPDKLKAELTPEEKLRIAKMEREKAANIEKFRQRQQEQEKSGTSKETGKNYYDKTEGEIEKEAEPKSQETPKPKKRYASAKEQMPLPEGSHKASEFNPTVRIDPDTALTKHTGCQTVEQFEQEVQATLEDQIALAKKEIEAGWKVFIDSAPKVADEDIIERAPNDDSSPPHKASTFSPSQ